MKSFFKIDFDITVNDDWSLDDLKKALGEWAQEHDIILEGLIRQVISLDVRDIDYIQVK